LILVAACSFISQRNIFISLHLFAALLALNQDPSLREMANSKISVSSTSMSRTIKANGSNHAVPKILLVRVAFLTFLCLVAVVFGFMADYFLTEGEKALADKQFDSITDRALDTAVEITRRKRLGAISMASVVSHAHPDLDAWPFVTVFGYEDISTKLVGTSSGRTMGFVPLVKPYQLEAFEAFAYKFFDQDRNPPFPEGTAQSSFGKGVWGVNPMLNTSDNRYHELPNSTTSYGSPNRIFTPLLQHNLGPHAALMLNLHGEKTRGQAIDSLMACADERANEENATIRKGIECIAITDILSLTSQEKPPGPGALIMQPIYPARDDKVVRNKMQMSGYLPFLYVQANILMFLVAFLSMLITTAADWSPCLFHCVG
jgi:hypothetical protein